MSVRILWAMALVGWLGSTVFAQEEKPWQEGQLVPLAATPVLVPSGVINLAGWRQGDSPVRLLSVVAERKRVKKGRRLAAFEYPQQVVQTAVEQRIALAEAEEKAAVVNHQNEVQKLQAELSLLRLEKKKAELELKKRSVLARRDVQLIELESKRVADEIDGLKMRIQARKEVLAATREFHRLKVLQALAGREQLAALKRRFVPRAAHAGRVYYPQTMGKTGLPRKGKRLRGGAVLLWLAPDDRVVVEFFLAEERLSELFEGRPVQVRSAKGKQVVQAEVIGINPIIHEQSDEEDARERGYRVRALLRQEKIGASFRPGRAARVRW